MYDTFFIYFSPTLDIMYELPEPPTAIGDNDGDGYDDADCCGLTDLSGSPNEEDENYNENYGGPMPDGFIDHPLPAV